MKADAPMTESKWAQNITVRFGKDSGVDEPDGFKDLQVGDKVSIELTGKITGITKNDGSSSFDLEMSEVELESASEEAKEEKKEPKSMSEHLEKKK